MALCRSHAVGLLLLLALPQLPPLYPAAAGALPFPALGLLHRRWLWSLWLPFGFCGGLLVADQHLASGLDTAYVRRDVQLDGWARSIPVVRGTFQELDFAMESLDGHGWSHRHLFPARESARVLHALAIGCIPFLDGALNSASWTDPGKARPGLFWAVRHDAGSLGRSHCVATPL